MWSSTDFHAEREANNYYDKTRRGWDMLHLLLHFSLKKTNLSHRIPSLHLSGNQMLVWGVLQKLLHQYNFN